jgi:hypothetical protein
MYVFRVASHCQLSNLNTLSVVVVPGACNILHHFAHAVTCQSLCTRRICMLKHNKMMREVYRNA